MLRSLQKNGHKNIRLELVKAESEAFEAKQKTREVIEMNKKWSAGYEKLKSENERLREVNSYLNKENKGLHKVIEVMQRAFDRVEKFLKGLSFWDKFKNRYRNADFEQYKEFQSIRHDNDLHANNKNVQKNHEIDDLYL